MKPTRYVSDKQEKRIAKKFNGRQTANSGAGLFQKSDVKLDNWLIEAKTKMTDSESMTIHRDWITKNEEYAFAQGKDHSAVAISFGDGKDYFIINEKEFKRLTGRED